jgi:hypothetical protein
MSHKKQFKLGPAPFSRRPGPQNLLFKALRLTATDNEWNSYGADCQAGLIRRPHPFLIASGQGDLAAFYIDEVDGTHLRLRALLTARTEDWHFLKTVLFHFLRKLPGIQAAGDELGLGRQICWEAASQFSNRFLKVNFAAKKHDLGFSLMNQLSVAEKRLPHSHQDIAADFFALRKLHTGTRWVFNQGRNILNGASHCDIAWAGALSSHAHAERRHQAGACVIYDHWGWRERVKRRGLFQNVTGRTYALVKRSCHMASIALGHRRGE